MITKFSQFKKIYEDGDGGGCGSGDSGGGTAFATLGGGGMGSIVAPQPGNTPGSYGTIGSGDLAGGGFGPYFKRSPYGSKPVDAKKGRRRRGRKRGRKRKILESYWTNE
jgi:hypothetical protein